MPAKVRTVAIDVGATRSRVALVVDGVIGQRWDRATADLVGPDRTITNGLVDAVGILLRTADDPAICAIGLGMAAAVDGAGVVLQARDFGIPAGPAIRDALAGAFGVPVAVDNDANHAALAEQRMGAARGEPHAAVITLGTNIGLGLILGGAIHRGAHGAAGEIGLLLMPARDVVGQRGDGRLVDAGPLGRVVSHAPQGYAWIEELVGGGALASAAGGYPRVFAPHGRSDPELRRLSERAIEGWAIAIADLVVMVDPGIIVLTGGVATDAAPLLNDLQRRVAELAGFPTEIRLGTLGPDAELLGADLLARASLDGATGRRREDARAGLSAQTTGEWR